MPTLLLALFAISSKAQPYEERLDKKISYVIEHLNLEEDIRNQFINLYRENSIRKMKAKEMRKEKMASDESDSERTMDGSNFDEERMSKMTEEEAQEIFFTAMEMEEQRFQENREFKFEIMKLIGAKNMLKLQKIEKEFHKGLRRAGSDGTER